MPAAPISDRRRRIRDELQRLMDPATIKTKADLEEAVLIEDREIQQIAIKDRRCTCDVCRCKEGS